MFYIPSFPNTDGEDTIPFQNISRYEPKGDDGSQFENYALTLLAAKMVLCEQGNIDIGRCTVPRMLTIVTESFGSKSHARHDRPLGGEVVVDAVAHMKRDSLIVVAVKFLAIPTPS